MRKALLSLLGGAALGAGAMYLYDPKQGGKRRAQIGDAATVAKKKALRAVNSTSQSLKGKANDVLAVSREWLGSTAPRSRSALWTPRTRAVLATAGLVLAALAGTRPQT
jgi:hypothetical protein